MGLRSAGGTPEWKSSLPPIPKWDLEGTRAKAKQIYAAGLAFHKWLNLTVDNRQDIVKCLVDELELSKKATLAAVETLLPYSEKELTPELIRLLCYQFAANWPSIQKGTPVQKFTGVPQALWLPMKIAGFELFERGTSIMAKMHVDILDGPYAGYSAIRVLPAGFLFIFAKDLGYSRRRPYGEPRDLKEFRFAAWVEPSTKDDIQFKHYWLTASMEKHNNALVRERKPTLKEQETYDDPDSDSEC